MVAITLKWAPLRLMMSTADKASDGIALALRCGSPVFVTERVLTAVSEEREEGGDEADDPLPRDFEDDLPEP